MGRRGGDVLSISLHFSQSRYLRSEGWNHKNPIINFVFPSPPPFRRHDSDAETINHSLDHLHFSCPLAL
jgi:hypothetical protein